MIYSYKVYEKVRADEDTHQPLSLILLTCDRFCTIPGDELAVLDQNGAELGGLYTPSFQIEGHGPVGDAGHILEFSQSVMNPLTGRPAQLDGFGDQDDRVVGVNR